MAKKSLEEQVLEQLDRFKVRGMLNTEEKVERYNKAMKAGYSPQFSLIFALQKFQR